MADEVKHEGRFARSWRLTRDSFTVVRTNGALLAYPVLGAGVGLIIFALAGGAIFGLTYPFRDEDLPAVSIVGIVVIVAIGLALLAYIAMKFSAGLIADAYARLTGEPGGIRYALGVTRQRRKHLIQWTLLNVTVGLVLSAISEAGDWAGAIVAAIGDFAWRVATWLVLPVIVVEDLGPIDGLKRSVQILKKTWGEQLIATAGFGFITMLGVLPGIAIMVLGLALQSPLFIVGVAWVVLAIPLTAIFVSALTAVFRTALYIYATTGESPSGFRREDVQQAFRPKRL